MGDLSKLRTQVRREKNPAKARILQGFFKTGKGEYGEGDVFLGLTVPQSRKIAKAFSNLDLASIRSLLFSRIHEERLIALLILVEQFKVGREAARKKIAKFYLKNSRFVNNWDLVDLSADKILGVYLLDKHRGLLRKLAVSKNLWERRMAIVATYQFIKKDRFEDTIAIARLLLRDEHDLIHKAVGWMLREVGKREKAVEAEFLQKYHKIMPRTMLRYAIERFPEAERKQYLG